MYNNEKLNELNKLITNEIEEIEKISQHNTYSKLMIDTLLYVQKLMVDIDDVVETSKECNRCGVDKPLDDYYTRPDSVDGYNQRCKECLNQLERDKRNKIKVSVGVQTRDDVEKMKTYLEKKNGVGFENKKCNVCGEEKPMNSVYFHKRNDSKDGYYNRCIECHRKLNNENMNKKRTNK